jgi:hypothetical protein
VFSKYLRYQVFSKYLRYQVFSKYSNSPNFSNIIHTFYTTLSIVLFTTQIRQIAIYSCTGVFVIHSVFSFEKNDVTLTIVKTMTTRQGKI